MIRRTAINTVATVSKESILNIDEDGDGKYDLKLRAVKNGYGEETTIFNYVYLVTGSGVLLILIIIWIIVRKKS